MNTTKAEQFRKAAREHLMKLAGVGTGRPNWGAGGAVDHARTASAGGIPRNASGMGYTVQYGKAPREADVDAFIKAMGGNPYLKPRQSRKATTASSGAAATAATSTAKSSPRDMLMQLAQEYQDKLDEANYANEFRYQQGLGMLGDVAARNQGRVDNWGRVQESLNAERAAESLKAQKAYLASRGLSNSNILPAFQARSDRDLALLQQDVSERRDARASEYDTRDTGAVTNWIQARYDNPPDPAMFTRMAEQLAQADAYSAQNRQAPTYTPISGPRQIPYRGGVRPGTAMRMAQQTLGGFGPNFGNPYAIMASAANSITRTPSWTSNAYPHRRGETRDQAYARRTGAY